MGPATRWRKRTRPADESPRQRTIAWHTHARLHGSLGYMRPIDHYRGDPPSRREAPRKKLATARHRRREKNLELRHATLTIDADQPPEHFWPQKVSLPVKQITC